MIQGKKKEILNIETILSKISEYDIYYRFFGPFKLNRAICNHLRGEHEASFIIGTKFGKVTHKDFVDHYWRGDCVNLVQQIHNNCNYNEALQIIDKEFGLGISNTIIKDYKREIAQYEQPVIEKKKYVTIQCITRKFTKEELQYWNEYYQDIEDLKREEIYSISKVYLNKQLFSIKPTELRFGYFYDGHWKIYRPFQDKKIKWTPNNTPTDYLEGRENVINCDTALITKSKKDKMVCLKVFPNVCATQNESRACFTEENIEFLKLNSKRQVLSFDSDKPGCKASLEITKEFDMDYINTPRSYLSDGINDWALLAKEYGLQTVEKIFKRKKLII